MLKRIPAAILAIALFLPQTAIAQEWEVVKGDHFLINYLADKKFAKHVLKQAEKYYDKIASDLGYSRYDKFWQWDDRVNIYIYRTQEEFMQATGRPEWVYGMAFYDEKSIVSYRWSEGFMNALLPHELTHLIFRDFVGFDGEIPLWMDEGVAQWQEEERRKESKEIVEELIEKKSFIPLSKLMILGSGLEKDPVLALKFYAQAVTLVGFLIERYGGSKFTTFCRQLRDGKTMDQALSNVYTTSISNIEELEKKWIAYYRR